MVMDNTFKGDLKEDNATKKADVIVYSTSSCPWCVKAKEFLKENNIEYEEHNVAEDAEALKQMEEKSGQRGVPVLDVKGTIIVGFDRDAIKAALGM